MSNHDRREAATPPGSRVAALSESGRRRRPNPVYGEWQGFCASRSCGAVPSARVPVPQGLGMRAMSSGFVPYGKPCPMA